MKLKDLVTIPEKKSVAHPELEKYILVQLHCKGLKINDKPIKPTKRGRPYYKRYENEILIGRQNIHNGSFGLVTPEFNGLICSNAITSLIPKENTNMEYLLYYLEHENYHKSLEKYMNGTGQKELSEKNILELPISIHDKNTQNKIAGMFKNLKYKNELHKNQLIQLKKYKKGLLQKMFC